MLVVVSWLACTEQGETAAYGLRRKIWRWLVVFRIISVVI